MIIYIKIRMKEKYIINYKHFTINDRNKLGVLLKEIKKLLYSILQFMIYML